MKQGKYFMRQGLIFLIFNFFLKRPLLQLIIGGLLATLGFAPIDLPIFLIPSFYLLLRNIYGITFKIAFYRGIIFGFFHFLSSLYWLGIALTSNVGNFLWLIPFAITLLPLGLGIFVGIICAIASFFKFNRLLFVISFSITWSILETIRGIFPLPFPWNFMGYTLVSNNYTLSLAPYLGIQLASLLVLILSTIFFTKNWRLIVLVYSAFIISLILANFNIKETEFHDETIRLIQPNILDHHLGKPLKQQEVMAILTDLSKANYSKDIKAIIWPEAAYPYLFKQMTSELEQLKIQAPSGGYLIFGTDRMDNHKRLYNSIIAINNYGQVVSYYDKHLLVPFGEYVPLRNIFSFIDKIAYSLGEFDKGENYVPLHNVNVALNYFPLICYEAIFPINQSLKEYDWLLNITNDAWFGNSSGPYQHLAMTRFKASEYGMPLIRVANNGISAIISSRGEILKELPLNTKDYLDLKLPKKISTSTLISKSYNIYILIVSFLICLCLNLVIRINPKIFVTNNEQTKIWPN